jgi:tetratricopeptide (TPR) repeat protein
MKFLIIIFFVLTPILSSAQGLQSAWDKSLAAESKQDYKTAISVLKASNDSSYMTLLRLGYLHYQSGLHIESMRYYQQCIQLMPYAIEPRFGFVNPAAALNNWAQVREQYEAILRIDPKQTLALYRMGLIHYNQQEYQKALSYFEKVINLYPADYDTLIMYAWTQLRLGKRNEARILFEKVLLISPNDASALEGLKLLR